MSGNYKNLMNIILLYNFHIQRAEFRYFSVANFLNKIKLLTAINKSWKPKNVYDILHRVLSVIRGI